MNKMKRIADMTSVTLEALCKAANWADNYEVPTTECCGTGIEEDPGEWCRCEKCGKLVWRDGRLF